VTDRPCLACERPMPSGDQRLACQGCWNRLERDLAQMPALLDELDATLARQGVTGSRNGGRGSEKPLPYDLGASTAHQLLVETLAPWVRLGLEAHPDAAWTEMTTPRALARALLRLHGWLQTTEDGHLAVDEIRYAVHQAERAIDVHEERVYAGPCTADVEGEACPADLYAKRGAEVVRCRTCGTEWDVHARHEYLVELARDRLVTTTEACRAVKTYTSGHLTPELVRQWKRRGRAVPHSHDGDGRDLWRLGDLVDLAVSDTPRQASG
jgi:hypothetical protein